MKKIYSYLFPVFLSFFALAACDEDNEEIVPMSYTDPVATVTKIEPVEGYVGNEFTINGDDFGTRKVMTTNTVVNLMRDTPAGEIRTDAV